jgi:hypothetical protein
MPLASLSANLFAWILQSTAIALAGASMPLILRVRHPRTQLIWCHAVLVLCLLLPFIQPWIRTSTPAPPRFFSWLPWIIAAGAVAAIVWMFFGLWRIRRCRIEASPLYPIPNAMRAASSITNANAMFCLSDRAAGPVMLGWLAPVVLLPESFLSLDEEAQCGIACHELLHVRRGDWLVTLLEEFAGALLWFNPGAWALRSEARLAREQLVDAESVRLTEAHEPYIEALLSIARGRNWSDLAPAPLFLRRSHLTQRMQRLVSEKPDAGTPRVVFSYGIAAATLALAAWFAVSAWPMTFQMPASAQPMVVAHTAAPEAKLPVVLATPTPHLAPALPAPAFSDPYEPVAGGIRLASTSTERSEALAALARASQNGLAHRAGEFPYTFRVVFTATWPTGVSRSGELTEVWMNGKKWSWTIREGDFEHTRLLYNSELLEDHHAAAIPMRAHTLRNHLFWAASRPNAKASIRTAQTMWHGATVTCILAGTEGFVDTAGQSGGRLWNEEEYCVDDAFRLVVYSPAPGSYTQFGYEAGIDFHGKRLPDSLVTFVNGTQVVSATFQIADPTQADADLLAPAPGMTSSPAPVTLGGSFVTRLETPAVLPGNSGRAIIHASIDGDGNVADAEVAASSSAAFSAQALSQIRQQQFGRTGSMRQAWIEVVPAAAIGQ